MDKLCIDVNTRSAELAKKRCPEGYHIEYTRRGFILLVKDGYHYDINDDLCYKDSE